MLNGKDILPFSVQNLSVTFTNGHLWGNHFQNTQISLFTCKFTKIINGAGFETSDFHLNHSYLHIKQRHKWKAGTKGSLAEDINERQGQKAIFNDIID